MATQVEIPEYRSLAPTAVVALVLGLVSATALISPLFLAVAGAAVGVALLALARIGRSEGHLTGSLLALTGIALAVAFAVASLVRVEVRDAYYLRQTTDVGQRFVALLASQQYESAIAQLTGRAAGRLRPSVPPGQEPPPDAEVLSYAIAQMQVDPVAQFVQGAEVTLELEECDLPPQGDRGSILMGCTYRLRRGGQLLEERLGMQFLRTPGFEAEGTPWRVDDWGLAEDE